MKRKTKHGFTRGDFLVAAQMIDDGLAEFSCFALGEAKHERDPYTSGMPAEFAEEDYWREICPESDSGYWTAECLLFQGRQANLQELKQVRDIRVWLLLFAREFLFR